MKNNRRKFLKKSGLAAMGFSGAKLIGSSTQRLFSDKIQHRKKALFNMCGYSAPKLDTVRVGIIGLGRGHSHLRAVSKLVGVEVKGISDLLPNKIQKAKEMLKGTSHDPDVYTGSEEKWKEMCERDDIDLIYVATPWHLHVPMALYAMEHGKHVGIEVPAATSIEDCWRLVEKSEETHCHCVILENCCYDFFELLTLNMARQGVFGEIVHAEGAYIHHLLRNLTAKNLKWNMWRLKENVGESGNLYPTHGLGPIAQILDINRGDKMEYIVSMSGNDFMLGDKIRELADQDDFYLPYRDKSFRGNMNTSIIRTIKGKTIMVQHDVTSPRPYSRLHVISGTKGTAQKYPLPGKISTDHNGWSSEDEMKTLEKEYQPAIVKKIGEIAKTVGGHGGMDFLMNWRLIDCLRNGLPMDMDVYDAATWSAILPLSIQSVSNRSMAVDVPDFTTGAWENNKPVDILLEKGGDTRIKS